MEDRQDPDAVALAVRASIERALAGQAASPLRAAAELLAEAMAADPSLASMLDASVLSDLTAALGLPPSEISTSLDSSPIRPPRPAK